MRTFEQIKLLASEYDSLMGERNIILQGIEKIYLVIDTAVTEDAGQGIKRTLSTDGRDAVLGITRILSAAEPRFHMPDEQDVLLTTESKASQVETLCTALWKSMSELNGSPLHFDIALSAALYGEVHIAVESMEEIAAGSKDKRAAKIAATNPVSARVINPQNGWPVFDQFGQAAYYSTQDIRWSDIVSRYDVTPEDHKDTDLLTVCEWWDSDQHLVWIEGGADPLLEAPNESGELPVACAVIEGGRLFANGAYNAYTRQPFLYALYQSGLWNRQNLYLTALYSQVFALGRFSKLVYHANADDKEPPDIDNSANGVIALGPGESIQPMVQQLIDPQLAQAGQFAFEKGEQTTIYKQVLGQALGSGVAFSTVNLLSQAGRLPVIPIQRMCAHAIKTAMNAALGILKRQGGTIKVGALTFKAGDIPEDPNIECELEANLPQDERTNAMIAQQLSGGEDPLTSKEYARTQILKIEQPDIEQEKIWREQAARVAVMREMAQQLQEAQAMLQQAMTPQQPMMQQGQPQGAPMQPRGGPTPEQQAMMQQAMMQQQGAIQPTSTGAQMGAPGMGMGAPVEPGMQPGGGNEQLY